MPATTTTQQGQEGGGGVVRGYSKCQDCGNQAKKECSYSRCRTCCKNKGFDCQTHIKSTWIPVDRRRQREEDQPFPSTTNTNNPFRFHGGDMSKRPKKHSGVEELKFPAATNSTEIFKRVEVRSMDDVVNETAYQTSVNIGGHVFSGLLYDQGPDHQSFVNSNKGDGFTLVQQQQNLGSVINASSTHQTHHHDGAIVAPLSASAAAHDGHFLPQPYPLPLASFRSGMPYFSYPKYS